MNAEAKIFTDRSSQDAYEVINYITAMNYGIERLQTLPFRFVLFGKSTNDYLRKFEVQTSRLAS